MFSRKERLAAHGALYDVRQVSHYRTRPYIIKLSEKGDLKKKEQLLRKSDGLKSSRYHSSNNTGATYVTVLQIFTQECVVSEASLKILYALFVLAAREICRETIISPN